MSSRNEKLELARKKLRQFKKQKQSNATEQSSVVTEDNNLSSNSSVNGGNPNPNSPGRHHSPNNDIESEYEIVHHSNSDITPSPKAENGNGFVMANLPPPNPTPNSQIIPSMQFDSYQELLAMKSELSEAANTISDLIKEKSQLEAMVEATKNYYSEQYTKSTETYVKQVSEYQKSLQQGMEDLEKKYKLETEYRKKLEEQIETFQENQSKANNDNSQLRNELDKCKEINEEIQEKLLTKTNLVHNLEIRNEELTSSLELANLSLKQHRVSLMSLEDSQSKDRKAQYELEKLQSQLDVAKESLQASQRESSTLKNELKNQRSLFEREKSELKTESFNLREKMETLTSENAKLSIKIEEFTEELQNVESKYIPRSEIAELNGKLQQATIEREQFIEELNSKEKKIEKVSEAMKKMAAQFDVLEEENNQLKAQASDKSALIEKSESDRVAISRALSQNAELKAMNEEYYSQLETLKKDSKFLEDKVATYQSKAESYDTTLQELFLAKNELENKSVEVDELRALLKELQEIEKLDANVQTDEMEASKDLVDVGTDPVFTGTSEEISSDVSVELRDVSTLTRESNSFETSTESPEIGDSSQAHEGLIEVKDAEIADLRSECSNKASEVSQLRELLSNLETEKTENYQSYQEKVQNLEKELQAKENEVKEFRVKSEEMAKQAANDGSRFTSTNQENRLISTNESTTLMDNYRKLQVKMQALGKECELLRYQNNQLETINAKLAGENDTIGDYIFMYHAQREAMKNRDKSKSEFIEKMVKEKETLADKVKNLEYLLTSMLSAATQQIPGLENATNSPKAHFPSASDGSLANQNAEESVMSSTENVSSSTTVQQSSKDFNDEIRAKMIEALETVKSVSLSTSSDKDNFSHLISTCKCCEGQILMV